MIPSRAARRVLIAIVIVAIVIEKDATVPLVRHLFRNRRQVEPYSQLREK